MKKVILRSFALATVVAGFVSNNAFALKDEGKFTPSFDVLGRYVLNDSTRKTRFDFMSQRLRLGGAYCQGAFHAAGEGELRGNNYGEYANGPQTTGGQSVGVRQAYVSYDVYQNDSNGTVNLALGRFIPKGANSYGDDAITNVYNLSGFFPEDGVMAQYSGRLASNLDFGAQLAVVNSLQLNLYSSTATLTNIGTNVWQFNLSGATAAFAGGSNFNGNGGGTTTFSSNPSSANSNTSDKAYIANVDASIDAGPGKVDVVAAYARQNNDISTAGSTVALTNARDVQYVEASLGYTYKDNLKAGLWYSLADLGETRTMNDTNAGATQFGSGNALKDQYSVTGLGIQFNSKLFGMSSFIAKDDMLTFGGGVEMFARRQSGTSSVSNSDAAKNDVSMFSVGAGYAKGLWHTELNASYFMASNSVFLNQGNNNYVNSASLINLVFGVTI